MIPGYNHNVKHQGRLYHVQTEDSGVKKAVIITHLFVGGTILSTERIAYGHLVESDEIDVVVRDLMQEQHKHMLRDLVSGKLDAMLLKKLGPPDQDGAQKDAALEWTPQQPADTEEDPAPAGAAAPPFDDRENTGARRVLPVRPAPATAPPAPSFGPRPPPTPPPPRIQVSRSLRSSGASSRDPEVTPPPGPAPVRRRDQSDPRVSISPVVMINPAPAPRGPRASPTISSIPRQEGAKEPEAAAERAAPRPRTVAPLFGENLVSDKSLDDVILHYLAEEYISEEKNSEDG